MTQTPAERDSSPSKGLDAPLTEGSLWRAIWVMSWPLTITTVASSIVGMVDVQVAGMLGATIQAAVGLSEQILFLFMIFIMSVGVGTTAMVSRAFGAKELDEATRATGQSLALSVVMGLALTVVAWLLAGLFLPLFSDSREVIAQGQTYLGIFALYLIPFSVVAIANASFRAIGDAKTPLVIVLTMTTINVIGDYLFVFGNWPVPCLGIRGIALAAVLADAVGAAIAVWRLAHSPLKGSLSMMTAPELDTIKRIVRIGIPSGLQRLSWAGAVFVLFFILSRCPNPTAALASWTIGMRVEGLLFMPLMALSLAVSSIVGQNLGARQVKRAFRAGWHVTWIGIGLMVVLATALFFCAPALASIMSRDAKTIEYTVSYLQINAIVEPFLAVNMILSGALQGAGDTRAPMWISIFCNWLVRLPLAWLMAITWSYGPTGAWLCMSFSVLISALLIVWRYQSKSWIKTRI